MDTDVCGHLHDAERKLGAFDSPNERSQRTYAVLTATIEFENNAPEKAEWSSRSTRMAPNESTSRTSQSWAEHMARANTDTESAMALRKNEGSHWWRDAQKKRKSKCDGVHPKKRFSCWLSQVTECNEGNTGWLQVAQDTAARRANEQA